MYYSFPLNRAEDLTKMAREVETRYEKEVFVDIEMASLEDVYYEIRRAEAGVEGYPNPFEARKSTVIEQDETVVKVIG